METPRELLTRLMREAAARESTTIEEMRDRTVLTRNVVRARSEFVARAYVELFNLTQIARFLDRDRTSVRSLLVKAGIEPKAWRPWSKYHGVKHVDSRAG